MEITECALYGEDPSIQLRKEGEAQKRQKCKYLPHKGKNVSTFLPLLPASYVLTRHPSRYEIARQLLVATSLPNKQTNQQRHQHSGPPEAVSGIDLSSGTEVGDKRGGGVGWGVDSKALKEIQSPLFLDQNPPRFHQN